MFHKSKSVLLLTSSGKQNFTYGRFKLKYKAVVYKTRSHRISHSFILYFCWGVKQAKSECLNGKFLRPEYHNPWCFPSKRRNGYVLSITETDSTKLKTSIPPKIRISVTLDSLPPKIMLLNTHKNKAKYHDTILRQCFTTIIIRHYYIRPRHVNFSINQTSLSCLWCYLQFSSQFSQDVQHHQAQFRKFITIDEVPWLQRTDVGKK